MNQQLLESVRAELARRDGAPQQSGMLEAVRAELARREQPEPSTLDKATRMAGNVGSGIMRGVANVAGLPGAAVTAAGRGLGFDTPDLGPQAVAGDLNKLSGIHWA